jgi:hypothetical protein
VNQRSCAVNEVFWLFVGHSAPLAGSLPLSVPVESLPRTAAPSGHNGRRQPLTHGNSAETAHKTLLLRVQEMVDNWHKSVRSRALPEEAMTGWNEGMTRLQQLAERLNRLDEQRGKYMTVSELNTEVFGIMQAFNRHIPAEEQLRRYGEARNQNGSEQQQKQAEMALNQLINRYQLEHAGKPERQP